MDLIPTQKESISLYIADKIGKFVSLKWQEEFYTICLLVLLPAVSTRSLTISRKNSNSSFSPSALLECVVMEELDRIKYPSFGVENNEGIFKNRKDFDAFVDLNATYNLLCDLGKDDDDLAISFLPEIYELFSAVSPKQTATTSLDKFTCDYLVGKMMGLLARKLESQSKYKKANKIYRELLNSPNPIFRHMYDREKWWERLLTNSRSHLKDPGTSAALSETATNDPSLPSYFIQSLQGKLECGASDPNLIRDRDVAKMTSLPVKTISMSNDYIPPENAGQRVLLQNGYGAKFQVENYVIDIHESEGWNGVHCEGSIFTMVTILLCWEVIF